MKEVKVADLDKEDIKIVKELEAEKEKIEVAMAQLTAKHSELWSHLRLKYDLRLSKTHYTKDSKAIYSQEI